MSLSGLDSESVKQAHEAAIADAAGWFLLKYETRAEVGLLKGGTGGFVETKETIAQYEEQSPLFGMVIYRKKKILLKYIPDDTSRLLQARLSVHLQGVIETFPHDALVSLTTAADLSETVLLSSISSLKSSGSVKSNKKPRPLTEILEDAGEISPNKPVARESRPAEIAEGEASKRPCQESDWQTEVGNISSKEAYGSAIDTEQRAITDQPPITSIEPASAGTQTRRAVEEERLQQHSSPDEDPVSSRTIMKDTYVPYVYKPKVKLGPRPAVDADLQSRKSGGYARPVSTLPAGVKMPGLRATQISIERPQTQQSSSKAFFSEIGRFAKMSSAVSMTSPDLERPPSRSGSIVTVPDYMNQQEPQSLTTQPFSVEKQRLMKALEKRKKHQLAKKTALEAQNAQASDNASSTDIMPVNTAVNSVAVESDDGPATTEVPDSAQKDMASTSVSTALNVPMMPIEAESGDLPVVIDTGIKFESSPVKDSLPSVSGESVKPKIRDAIETKGKISSGDKLCNETVTAEETPSPPTNRVHSVAPSVSSIIQKSDSQNSPHSAIEAASVAPYSEAAHQDYEQPSIPIEISSLEPEPEGAIPQTPKRSLREEIQESAADSPSAATITPNDVHEIALETRASTPDSEHTELATGKNQRPEPIEPSKLDTSDAASLSGDSFLDEIQSATLEEAQPMVVSRSPATPVFPSISRRSSETSRLGRSVSTPYDTETPPVPTLSPEIFKFASEFPNMKMNNEPSPRSVPSPLDVISPQSSRSNNIQPIRSSSKSPGPSLDGPNSKKGGVSSLISSRIKALEKLSISGPQSNTNTAVVAPSLVKSRKSSLTRTPPNSSGNDASWNGRPYPTPSPSPHGNIIVRTFGSRRTPSVGIKPHGEAISVTTSVPQERGRPTQERFYPSSSDMASSVSAASSPPSVHVQPPEYSSSFFSKSVAKKSKPKSKTNSVSSISSAVLESLTSTSRNSFSSRRSSSKGRKDSGETMRVPISPLRPASSEGRSSNGDMEKKESKKSRLLRRMSSMSFSPRKNIAHALSPTLNDQPIIEHQEPESNRKWSPMALGDVNVQFPDTLLWKRRNLEIDSHGYLILAPSNIEKHSKISTKRYHISEFRMPYIPDQDREELPHSIILDFQDNSTLQCACEHSQGQLEVLQVLLNAHSVFHSASRR